MNSEQKTFIINTMSEATYVELSSKSAISDKQLNIVDDNDTNRTVIASYDLLQKKAGAELTYTKDGSNPYISLKNAEGSVLSKIDASDFIKDGMLNGISYGLQEGSISSYGLTFDIKMPDDTISSVYIQTTDDAFLSSSTNAVTNRTVISGFALVEDSIKEIKKTLLGFDEKLNILDKKFDSYEKLNKELPAKNQALNDTVKVIQNDIVIYYTVTEVEGVKTWTETKREDAAFIPTQNIDPSKKAITFTAGSSNDYSRLSSDVRVPSSKLISQMFTKTDADIAELAGKISNKTDKKISSSAGTAEIFNETDGGGSKFTTYDNKIISYVGVNDPNQSGAISGIAGQLYVIGDQQTKLNMYDGKFCYVKGNNPSTDSAKEQLELVVKSDIKDLAISSDVTERINALSSTYLSKIDGGTVSADMSVKSGLTIKDSNLFIPGYVGAYSNLSIGTSAFQIENVTGKGSSTITVNYPSVTDTLAVKTDISDAICALTANYIKKYGDTNIGTLQLSGSIKIGDPIIYSKNNATALALDASVVGCKGYLVSSNPTLSWEVNASKTEVTLSADFDFDSRITVGEQYAMNNSGDSPAWCGKVTYIAGKVMKLDGKACNYIKKSVNGIFFPEHPDYGHDIVTGTLGASLGYGCYAMGPCSYSEGYNNRSAGKYAHTEGNNTKAGWGSHAEGADTAAIGICSHSAGRYVSSYQEITYAWAGDGTRHVLSSADRSRTFNIWPQGGVNGFYIGDKTLSSIIREVVDGRMPADPSARIIPCGADTLLSSAEQFVDANIEKSKSAPGEEPVWKTIDEIKAEADHIYAYIDKGDSTYEYRGIKTTQHKDVDPAYNTYEWRELQEKQTTSYIKKEGDTDIGNIQLSGSLSVDSTDKVCIGNKKLTDIILTYDEFCKFVQQGSIVKRTIVTLSDDTEEDGGFYTVTNGPDGLLVFGTYMTGIWYAQPDELDHISQATLNGEEDESQYFKSNRFKSITSCDIGFVTINYDKHNAKHRVYKSTDCKTWQILRAVDDTRCQANSKIAYAENLANSGKNFYVYGSGNSKISIINYSSDVCKTWNAITAPANCYYGHMMSIQTETGCDLYIMACNDTNKTFKIQKLNVSGSDIILTDIYESRQYSTIDQSWLSYSSKINGQQILFFNICKADSDNYIYGHYNITTGQLKEILVNQDGIIHGTRSIVGRALEKYHDYYLLGQYDGKIYVSVNLMTWYLYRDLYQETEGSTQTISGVEGFTIDIDGRLIFCTRRQNNIAKGETSLFNMYMLNDLALVRIMKNSETASDQIKRKITESLGSVFRDEFGQPVTADDIDHDSLVNALSSLYENLNA